MSHVVLHDDAANRRLMLLALAGHLAPQVWQQGADAALARLGHLAGYRDFDDAVTGIAANDCHQNVGLRGCYTATGVIRVEDTSPKTLKEIQLNRFTRPVARLAFGRLEPDRKLFHVQLDP